MKWGTMQEKLAEKGEVVQTKRWGRATVLHVEYQNDLNWYTYTVATDYGQTRIQNDGFLFKAGKVVKEWNFAKKIPKT